MLGNRIRRLRQKENISRRQLADTLHISPSAIGMYEQERRIPSLELIVALAAHFDVSIDYLITGREFHSGTAPSLVPKTYLETSRLSLHLVDIDGEEFIFKMVSCNETNR